MSLIGSAWGFVRRHRLKFAILAGGCAAIYVAYSVRQKYLYIKRFLEEEREGGAHRLQQR